MGRDRNEMIKTPWWVQGSQYGDASYAAGTGVVIAGTAVIALPHGDISSIATGIDIFVGRTAIDPGRIHRVLNGRLRRRRRVCA